MFAHKERLTGTASSGSFTVNTQHLNGLLRQVIVSPTTVTTAYDIKITDPNSLDFFQCTSQVGNVGKGISLPIHGINTVAIDNASADEAFTIELALMAR